MVIKLFTRQKYQFAGRSDEKEVRSLEHAFEILWDLQKCLRFNKAVCFTEPVSTSYTNTIELSIEHHSYKCSKVICQSLSQWNKVLLPHHRLEKNIFVLLEKLYL